MPGSSLCEGSDSIGLLKTQHQLPGWILSRPLDDFVKTILSIAIIVRTGGLVEVEVNQIVVRNRLFSQEVIQSLQTLDLYVLEVSLR